MPALFGVFPVELGQHHVVDDAAVGEQMKRLEYEADAPAPQPGPLLVGEIGDVDSVEVIGARCLQVEGTDYVEKRRFP